jgi:fatty-acyl-CoA synthase/long-chain acyl-CoA synthetase
MGAWFERSLRLNASRVALVDPGGVDLSYAVLDAWSAELVASLQEVGIGPGDVVAILTGNRAEFLVSDVAVARLGAVKLPINQLLPPSTVGYMLEHSGAGVVVVAPPHTELAQAALAEFGGAIPVIQVMDAGPGVDGAVAFPERPATGPAVPGCALVAARPPGGAPAALYYTGGTTGRPKGVLHSQRSLTSFHVAQLLEAEIRQHERLLLVTPLAHAAGLFAQSALLRGATIVIESRFDPRAMLDQIRHDSITWTFLVPTMIYRLLDTVAATNESFPALATIVYGAAPMSPDRLRVALDRFGPVFLQLYGQTECPNWGTRLAKVDHRVEAPELLSSCGQASIMTEVQIVDDDGVILSVGSVGEVCLRSPYVLDCYYKDEEATAAKFLGPWIRTGDIGLLDRAGYLYLKDRRADMVISGGMNVYCREVEDVLMAHPNVTAAAVIGIPHDDWGEAVHAVVSTDGTLLTEEEVVSWTRGRLPAYAVPKSVEFTDSFPETPFGKIDKKQLRVAHWTGHDRAIH